MKWEYKALIGIIVITFSLIFYAYNPFFSGDKSTPPQPSPPPAEPQPAPIVVPKFNNSSNDTNSTGDFEISAEKAKEIASKPGYTTREPTSGSIKIQGEDVEVWIVPLYKDQKLAERVYISKTDGKIIATEKF
ncbi:peptidase [Methanothermobacter tenebrarum]